MHPVLLNLPFGISIKAYGLMMMLGFLAATWWAMHRARQVKADPDVILNLGFISLVSGIVGARLFYVIFYDWNLYMQNPLKIFAVWEGGIVIYGAIILGGLALYLYLRKKPVNHKALFDIIGLSLLIGIGFGRIGCLGFGCCYGKPTGSPGILGLVFPKESPAWLDQVAHGLIGPDSPCSQPVWPTQIISSAGLFLMFFVLFLVYRRKKFDGEIVSLVFICYGVGRFCIEFLRINPKYGPFSAAQWTSLLLVLLGIFLFSKFRKSSKTASLLSS